MKTGALPAESGILDLYPKSWSVDRTADPIPDVIVSLSLTGDRSSGDYTLERQKRSSPMLQPRHPMRRLRIATPCQTTWESMAGDARVRHCGLCDLNVYNFAAMTRAEISELLVSTEGRVCARLYQRADGKVLTKDCPSGFQALRQRVSGLGATLLAALVGLSAFSFGCATSGKSWPVKRGSRVELDVERVAALQQAAFAGVVRDETGPLPGVSIRVRDERTRRETLTTTDEQGAFTIAAIGEGTYRVEMTLAGFEPAVIEHVAVKPGEVTRARVTLRFDQALTVMVGAIMVEPTNLTNPGMSTTFSQEFIANLPIGN